MYCAVLCHAKHWSLTSCNNCWDGLSSQVVGSQARILYSNDEGRIAIALAFNKAVCSGRLKVLFVVSSYLLVVCLQSSVWLFTSIDFRLLWLSVETTMMLVALTGWAGCIHHSCCVCVVFVVIQRSSVSPPLQPLQRNLQHWRRLEILCRYFDQYFLLTRPMYTLKLYT